MKPEEGEKKISEIPTLVLEQTSVYLCTLYFSSDLRLDVVYPIAFLEPAKQIHSLASQL